MTSETSHDMRSPIWKMLIKDKKTKKKKIGPYSFCHITHVSKAPTPSTRLNVFWVSTLLMHALPRWLGLWLKC